MERIWNVLIGWVFEPKVYKILFWQLERELFIKICLFEIIESTDH